VIFRRQKLLNRCKPTKVLKTMVGPNIQLPLVEDEDDDDDAIASSTADSQVPLVPRSLFSSKSTPVSAFPLSLTSTIATPSQRSHPMNVGVRSRLSASNAKGSTLTKTVVGSSLDIDMATTLASVAIGNAARHFESTTTINQPPPVFLPSPSPTAPTTAFSSHSQFSLSLLSSSTSSTSSSSSSWLTPVDLTVDPTPIQRVEQHPDKDHDSTVSDTADTVNTAQIRVISQVPVSRVTAESVGILHDEDSAGNADSFGDANSGDSGDNEDNEDNADNADNGDNANYTDNADSGLCATTSPIPATAAIPAPLVTYGKYPKRSSIPFPVHTSSTSYVLAFINIFTLFSALLLMSIAIRIHVFVCDRMGVNECV
jgi:hypothetical protein